MKYNNKLPCTSLGVKCPYYNAEQALCYGRFYAPYKLSEDFACPQLDFARELYVAQQKGFQCQMEVVE